MLAPLTELLHQQLLLFVLVLTRLGLMLAAMPALGGGVPMRVRAVFAIALSLLLMPLVPTSDLSGLRSLVDLAIAVAREGLIGMLIGAVVQLLVTGLQTAGELISNTGGMQLGDGFDPQTRSTMPGLARLIGMLAGAVMILVGGHRQMIDALLGSFSTMPPGAISLDADWLELVVGELASGLAAGVRAAAPVVAALLLSNLITGLLSRTLPQLNVLAIGLNINALALLTVTALSIGSIGLVCQEELVMTIERLMEFLE